MSEKSINVLLSSVLALVLTGGVLAGAVSQACACPVEAYIGSICVVPYPKGCPSGYLPADGRSLPVNQNQALYSLIGPTFGGSGNTSFNLPDLRGRMPVGVNNPPKASTTAVTLGQQRGAESVNITVTANNLPPHTHGATFTPTAGTQNVTLPAVTGAGSITATATTDVVPGNPGTIRPVANVANYYLTGVGGTTSGPVTQTPPSTVTGKSTLIGTTVRVDSSTYKPAIPAQTVPITTVTGGTVAVTANTTQNAPVAVSTIPPQVGLYYCIATTGMYPQFDN